VKRRGIGAALVGAASLALIAAACSSPSSSSGFQPHPAKGGLTLFSYPITEGQVVGTIDGIVAYSDTAEHAGHFVCTSASCTATWRPWLTDGAKVHAGAGVEQSQISTVTRPDGTTQVSYGGHPLYFYAHNKHAVQANAQGAGGVWYVVGTGGDILK
jgi:predicted lipoprotein with Yx(FWY)xxD motif